MTQIKLIYAASLNGCIGKDGKLPWSIPEDLKRFKDKTVASNVIMGRKTWESLPNRPLPSRAHYVVTTDRDLEEKDQSARGEQVRVIQHPFDVFNGFRPFDKRKNELWVIGGTSLFTLFLPFACEVHETLVDKVVHGDAFAAPIPRKAMEFERDASRSDNGWQTSSSGERYCTTVWVRKPNQHFFIRLGDIRNFFAPLCLPGDH